MITLTEDPILVCRVALVGRASEAKRVGFHDVKFRAGCLCTFACTTVHERIFGVINSRHTDSIEGSQAATSNLAEIYVILDKATKHIRSEVLRHVCVLAP